MGCIFYTYYIFLRFCIPVFQNFNTEHVTFKMLIHSILNCTLPATLLLLVAFYAFLHCWLNAFGEMLRFGDRMFYKVIFAVLIYRRACDLETFPKRIESSVASFKKRSACLSKQKLKNYTLGILAFKNIKNGLYLTGFRSKSNQIF